MVSLTSLCLLLLFISNAVFAQDRAEEVMSNDINKSLIEVKVERILTKQWERIVDVKADNQSDLLFPCPSTWTFFGGMCLKYTRQRLSWREAEDVCIENGGHLAWIENAEEHDVLRNFLHLREGIRWLWIGLYRNNNSQLRWSNGGDNNYTGEEFSKESRKVFATSVTSLWISGKSDAITYSSVCRREVGRSDKSLANVVREESRRVLQFLEEKFKMMEEKLAESERRLERKFAEHDKCPQPWIRHEGMCLLYNLQIRTWDDAQDLCTVLGGVLTWFENERELNIIRRLSSWTHHEVSFVWFWTGLHRMQKSHKFLNWVGKSESKYHGSKLNNPSLNFFRADARSTELTGEWETAKRSSVCRRY